MTRDQGKGRSYLIKTFDSIMVRNYHHYEQEQPPGVFGWIFEEAQEQADEACSGANYDADASASPGPSSTRSVSDYRDVDDGDQITIDSNDLSSYGTEISSRVSLNYDSESDFATRRNLRTQAHRLTQKILRQDQRMQRYQQREQNDADYTINRERSILASDDDDEEDGTSSAGYTNESSLGTDGAGPSRLLCRRGRKNSEDLSTIDEEQPGKLLCKLGKKNRDYDNLTDEEESVEGNKKPKKRWMRKRLSKSNDNDNNNSYNTENTTSNEYPTKHEKQKDGGILGNNPDDMETVIDVFGEPGDSDEDDQLHKAKRRKLLVGSLIALLVILATGAVLCWILVRTWDNDGTAEGSTAAATNSTFRTNSSFDSTSPWADNTPTEDSILYLDEEPSPPSTTTTTTTTTSNTGSTGSKGSTGSTGSMGLISGSVVDTDDDDDEDDPDNTDEQTPTAIVADSNTEEPFEDYAAPNVDPELLEKHLEAYRRWREENGFDDDDERDQRAADIDQIDDDEPYQFEIDDNDDDIR